MKKELKIKIEDLFSRGIGEFIDPNDTFKNKLIAKAEGKYDKDIIIKYGVDPTRPDIHLGHAVCFWKLRQLQELGCKIVFLVGDFTAQIGDPTGKSKVRPELELEEVEKNVATYVEQVERIINVEKDENNGVKINSKSFSWIRNSDWYAGITDMFVPGHMPGIANNSENKAKLWQATRMQNSIRKDGSIDNVTFFTFLAVLRRITHARLIDRDMFKDRLKNGQELYMHEMMYPVLQGIDSFVLHKIYGSCDLEVGGTDQTFNMLMGRDVMSGDRENPQEPQSVLSFKLLVGTDGKEKMSKSLDNYIAITEEPDQMFGKVMSMPDSSIINYFELCTSVPMNEIKKIEKEMFDETLNPRDAKLRLAGEIVEIYHGEQAAREAREFFINTFSKKEIPTDIAEQVVQWSEPIDAWQNIIDFAVSAGFAASKGDAKRKLEQGGFSIDGVKVSEVMILSPELHDGKILKVGKRDFVKIIFKK